MRRLFERTISIDEFSSIPLENPPALLVMYGDDAEILKNSLCPSSIIEIKHEEVYTSSSTTSADIQDIITVYYEGKDTYLPIIDDLEDFFVDVIPPNTAVFLDITNMGLRLLSILISNLVYALEKRPDIPSFFCGYDEPVSYFRRGINVKDENNKQNQFELYSDFAPIGPLPNFDSVGSDDGKQLWVVLLGFEGYRTDTIDDELSRIDDIIALVTVPSMKLGWSNYAITENSHFLRGVDHREPIIKYVTATSPFSVYNMLCDLKDKYSKYRLQISPFSTKANSLGVLLYALADPECAIIFDNPLESSRPKEKRSGAYHVFDVTSAIKQAIEGAIE